MIVAIDPSLTCTAVCAGSFSDGYQMQSFTSRPRGNSLTPRFNRYVEMVGKVMDWINMRPDTVSQVIIEGYSFNTNDTAKYLAEFGAVLRLQLRELAPTYEVAPASLKKFASGKGNSKKAMVAAALARRYQVMFDDDNQFDAYGLYRMGLCAFLGDEPQTQQQRAAIEASLGFHKPSAAVAAGKPF